ncbi:hypothetical protein BaRGS_00001027 [Batillaria attramentaria]|uniref:SSD domain-containing protein n=1 Tax=Batillaria attramentaria TaxID=370345 RepID=A0ABD0M9J6_9CAEN
MAPENDSDDKTCSVNTCHKKATNFVSGIFRRYGTFVARNPLPFIVIPILVFGGLGAGLVAMDPDNDMERVYFPMRSRALDDRQIVRNTFPNMNNVSYNPFSQSDLEDAVTLLFKSKHDQDIFNQSAVAEMQGIVNRVKAISVTVDHQVKTFADVCAKFSSSCVVGGEYALENEFLTALASGSATYPYWVSTGGVRSLFTAISGVKTQPGGVLTSATVLRISFKLTPGSEAWQEEFLSMAKDLDPVFTEVYCETPDSLSVELDKGTNGDIWLFSLTITLCCTYASIVASGGNPISTRCHLAFGGVLAAGLGILGAMGLLRIGIDDMFLLMSSWSETLGLTELTVPARVGETFAKAGIGITITSVTDFLAFCIGTTSVFRSVTNFSLYAGVAVLFCYVCNATLFGGCLTYHGRRVYSSRHFLTCRKTTPGGRCSGSIPDKERADESLCEKLPRLFLPKVILSKFFAVRIVILLGFVGYLATAIYGAVNLKQGLVLKNLVPESSYYYKFLELQDQYFPTRLPVGFIVDEKVDYSGNDGVKYLDLLTEARKDREVDSSFEKCWLSSYKNSTLYSAVSPQTFVQNLQNFLATSPEFQPDVVFDSAKTEVVASRCFVWSEPNSDQYSQADLMVRMRDLADASSLPVFAYHSAFVAYEQFLAVLPATLQMVGCAVAVMFVVTFIFLPHPLMVFLVTLTIIMILVGIFGFMYYWDISLSSITMIHLVMSVGFSVDFSAHVCAAYLVSDAHSRKERAHDAITHAAGPILNGAVSTLLGVILLVFSDSYIFTSFFNIMFLVIVFGMLHAVLFLPVVLSLIGPQDKQAVAHLNGSTGQTASGCGGGAANGDISTLSETKPEHDKAV